MPDIPPRVEDVVDRGGEHDDGDGAGALPRPVWTLGAEVSVPAFGERCQSRKK